MVKILKDLFPNDGTGRGHVGMEAGLRSEGRKKKDAALPSKNTETQNARKRRRPKRIQPPTGISYCSKEGLFSAE